MSKKTRRQKIIADLRRQLAQTKSPKLGAGRAEYIFKPQNDTTVAFTSNSGLVSADDYSYVKHDLLKTVILTTLAIGVQIMLLFVLRK